MPAWARVKGRACKSESLKAFLLYILVMAFAYGPIVFLGSSLIPSLYQPGGITEQGAWGFEGRRPQNTFSIDLATPAYYESPVNRLVGDMLRRGELPLWNPHQAAGTPLLAQYSTRALFPYQMLEDVSPWWTWDFFMLTRLVIAGFFTFVFLRSIGLGFDSSFLGGVFYMLSGSFVWFINLEQMTNVAMLAPMLLICMERLSRSGAWRDVGLSAIVFGLVLFAGQPEVALYVLFLAGLYFIYRAGFDLKRFSRLAVGFALGLLMAAPLIFPFMELWAASHHIHPVGGIMGEQALTNWKRAFLILTPSSTEILQTPDMVAGLCPMGLVDGDYYRFLPVNGVWDTLGGYTGVVPVFLAVSAVCFALSGRGAGLGPMAIFFFAFAVSVILKNIGVAPFVWLGRFPFFDQVWSLRWAGPAWVFSLSIAGAMGLEILQRQKPLRMPRQLLLSLMFMAIVYVVFVFLPTIGLVLDRESVFGPAAGPFVIPSIGGSLAVFFIALVFSFFMCRGVSNDKGGTIGIILLATLELWWAVPRGYAPPWLMLKWAPFVLGLAGACLAYKRRAVLGWALVAASFISFLFIDMMSPHGFPKRQDPFKEAPYVEFLKRSAGHSRVVGLYGVLFPNTASATGLQDVHYINSLASSGWHEFRTRNLHADRLTEEPVSSLWFTGRPERCEVRDAGAWGQGRYVAKDTVPPADIFEKLPYYSLLGVRYFIVPSTVDVNGFAPSGERRLSLVYDKEVRIYENPFARERAWMEGGPPGASAGIREYSSARVVVGIEGRAKGMLVLSDAYYPGWKAEVNGKEAKVERVHGVLRGVHVDEAGDAEVVFSYAPASFTAGVASSISALAVCGALMRRRGHGRA